MSFLNSMIIYFFLIVLLQWQTIHYTSSEYKDVWCALKIHINPLEISVSYAYV